MEIYGYHIVRGASPLEEKALCKAHCGADKSDCRRWLRNVCKRWRELVDRPIYWLEIGNKNHNCGQCCGQVSVQKLRDILSRSNANHPLDLYVPLTADSQEEYENILLQIAPRVVQVHFEFGRQALQETLLVRFFREASRLTSCSLRSRFQSFEARSTVAILETVDATPRVRTITLDRIPVTTDIVERMLHNHGGGRRAVELKHAIVSGSWPHRAREVIDGTLAISEHPGLSRTQWRLFLDMAAHCPVNDVHVDACWPLFHKRFFDSVCHGSDIEKFTVSVRLDAVEALLEFPARRIRLTRRGTVLVDPAYRRLGGGSLFRYATHLSLDFDLFRNLLSEQTLDRVKVLRLAFDATSTDFAWGMRRDRIKATNFMVRLLTPQLQQLLWVNTALSERMAVAVVRSSIDRLLACFPDYHCAVIPADTVRVQNT